MGGGEREIFFFFPTHNRWKKIMDDEREELAEKESSYEWILFFFVCLHVCILKHLDVFFAVFVK